MTEKPTFGDAPATDPAPDVTARAGSDYDDPAVVTWAQELTARQAPADDAPIPELVAPGRATVGDLCHALALTEKWPRVGDKVPLYGKWFEAVLIDGALVWRRYQ